MNVVRAVMILILVIAVLGVATIITLVSIRDVAEDIDRTTVSLTNDTTLSAVNETGISLITIAGIDASGILDCTLSPTIVTLENATASIVPTTNWIVSANCTIASTGGATSANYNGTAWNVTGAFTYSPRNTRSIQGNISEATSDFFGNTGTFFAILVVVVIILAIAIIITVVSGFGGGRIGGGRGAGAGSITGI